MRWLFPIPVLLACSGEETPLAEEVLDPVEAAASVEVRYTQERLAADPSAVTITGELVCAEGTGPWTVRLWSLRRSDRERAPDVLPAGDILTQTTLDAPGPFTVFSIRSARLMVLGLSADEPPVVAWGDVHGRYTEAVQDLSGLILDCNIHPTPSPDGTLMATQGTPVVEEPEPVVASGADPQMERLVAIPSAAKVDVFRRRPEEIGGVETLDRIEARYNSQLSEEELLFHMPILYQLADNPKEADEYVRGVVSTRSSSSGKPNTPQVIQ